VYTDKKGRFQEPQHLHAGKRVKKLVKTAREMKNQE